MEDGSDADAAPVAAIHDLLASPPDQRHSVLAHNVVEFGPLLISSLQKMAENPAGHGFREADQELLTELTGQAVRLEAASLTGERITARADERERRILALKRQARELGTPSNLPLTL
jgi:hypothetical protein